MALPSSSVPLPSSMEISSPSLSPTSSMVLPTPSTTSGGSGGDNGGGGGFGGFSSSASLYLYTFLATLVLLLTVSGAIILRSFVLRRRHRRLMEEAIRNGTWIPPSPGWLSRTRIDLSQKPILWDAYVDSEKEHELPPSLGRKGHKKDGWTEWDWDSIRPFTAAYLEPPPGETPTRGPIQSQDQSIAEAQRPRPSHPQPVTARLLQFIHPNPRIPRPHPLPQIDPRVTAKNINPNSVSVPADFPNKLSVAVLIAMPRQPTEGSSDKAKQNSPSTSTDTSPLSANDGQPFPLVEFGLAELDVKEWGGKDPISPTKSESGTAQSLDV